MYTLYHHPFCPHSRFIRLVLGEHGLDLRLVGERAWERPHAFLAPNPAAATPALTTEGFPPRPGAGSIAGLAVPGFELFLILCGVAIVAGQLRR